MHISEGVLSLPVLATGGAATLAFAAIGLKRLDNDKLTSAALLSAAFFTASLIHVPIGPASVHLILGGLLGVILGWAAYPVILAALTLQAVLFQFGGLTSLGVNGVILGLPPVICHYVFRPMLGTGGIRLKLAAFCCGAASIAMSGILAALALALSGDHFLLSAKTLLVAHLPVMVVEGLITAAAIAFLIKVKPEVLDFVHPVPSQATETAS